jgi:CheY-like chemotaxis protein
MEDKALLSISISDTGVGIKEEFLPKIFDAFTQEYTDNTTLYSGSGLGLAISKNLVNLLNGDIEVISNKDKGTTFIVKVNVGVAKECQKDMEPIQNDGQVDYTYLANKRILLVEDNEINLEVAKAILEHVGILVDCEENGRAAVERFAQVENGYYHAILMDIRMPVMDGLDATRRIRKLPKEDARRIPIIAMTANVFEEDIKKSMKAGMNYHMTKPIEPKSLYELLLKVIR